VRTEARWRGNWLVLSPPGAVRVDVGRSPTRRRAIAQEIRALPSGTPVALCASFPGAIGRCRTFAWEAGVEPDREYLAFPSATAPAYLVEDAPASIGFFLRTLLIVPPGTPLSAPIEAVLRILRAVGPSRLIRRLAPGRVVVGRRA
jgi:hypothetical protein